MDSDDLTMTDEEFHAEIVKGAIAATAPAGESAAERHARVRGLVAMYRAYRPAGLVQGMLTGQILMLRHATMAALKDLNHPDTDLKTLTRMRAVAVSMNKALDTAIARLEKMQAADAQASEPAPEPPARAARQHDAKPPGVVRAPVEMPPQMPPPGMPNTARPNGAAHPPPR